MARPEIAVPTALDRAVAKRKGEYRGGRACAKDSIRQLKSALPAFDENSKTGRSLGRTAHQSGPVSITDSLARSDSFVIRVTRPSKRFTGQGIDIEASVPPRTVWTLRPRYSDRRNWRLSQTLFGRTMVRRGFFWRKRRYSRRSTRRSIALSIFTKCGSGQCLPRNCTLV